MCPLPMSPPVDNSICCCGVRSARLSDPTRSQLVPLPAAGRSGYAPNTSTRRNDDSIQIAVVRIAVIAIRPIAKVLSAIRLPHRAFFLVATRPDRGGRGAIELRGVRAG